MIKIVLMSCAFFVKKLQRLAIILAVILFTKKRTKKLRTA